MAILVLFQEFSRKFCFNCFSLVLTAMMHPVRTFSIMRAVGVKAYRYQRGSEFGKILYIKNVLENGWWEDAYPSSYPWIRPWP